MIRRLIRILPEEEDIYIYPPKRLSPQARATLAALLHHLHLGEWALTLARSERLSITSTKQLKRVWRAARTHAVCSMMGQKETWPK